MICQKKLGFVRYNPKKEWDIKGQLCKECYDKKAVESPKISKQDKNELCVCGNAAVYRFKMEGFCAQHFTQKYGDVILFANLAYYYGGHKAYVAGGYFSQEQSGKMYMTEGHIIFSKEDKHPEKRWEIVIPIKSIQVNQWTIEEEVRRKQIAGGGTSIGDSGLMVGGGTINDSGKSHHLVIAYIDENGIPQAPRFGLPSFRGKAIREWASKLYEQVTKVHGNTNSQTAPIATQDKFQVTKAEDPLQILKLRLARGEITKEEYEELIKVLQS